MALSKTHQDNLRELIRGFWDQALKQPGGDAGPLSTRFTAELNRHRADIRIITPGTTEADIKAIEKEAYRRTQTISLQRVQEEFIALEESKENGQPTPPQFGTQFAAFGGNQLMATAQNVLGDLPGIGWILKLLGVDKLLPMVIKLATVGTEYFTQKTPPGGKGKGFMDLWVEQGQKDALRAVAAGLGIISSDKTEQFVSAVMSDTPLNLPTQPSPQPPGGFNQPNGTTPPPPNPTPSTPSPGESPSP